MCIFHLSKTKICANKSDLFNTLCNYSHLKTWGLDFLSEELMHSCLFSLLQTKKNLYLLHWGANCIHIQLCALFGSGVPCSCHPSLWLRFLSQNLWLIPKLINKTLVGCGLWSVIVPYCPIFSCALWPGFSWWWLMVFHHIQAQCRGNNVSHKREKRPSFFRAIYLSNTTPSGSGWRTVWSLLYLLVYVLTLCRHVPFYGHFHIKDPKWKKKLKITNSILFSAFTTCKQTQLHARWIYVNEHQLKNNQTSPASLVNYLLARFWCR